MNNIHSTDVSSKRQFDGAGSDQQSESKKSRLPDAKPPVSPYLQVTTETPYDLSAGDLESFLEVNSSPEKKDACTDFEVRKKNRVLFLSNTAWKDMAIANEILTIWSTGSGKYYGVNGFSSQTENYFHLFFEKLKSLFKSAKGEGLRANMPEERELAVSIAEWVKAFVDEKKRCGSQSGCVDQNQAELIEKQINELTRALLDGRVVHFAGCNDSSRKNIILSK